MAGLDPAIHAVTKSGCVEEARWRSLRTLIATHQRGWPGLDSIRNPKIWEKTKKGAEAAGGFTVDLLKDLAKGL
jgi:hypothetical protein